MSGSSSAAGDVVDDGIWQRGRRHPLFGTPVVKPAYYAWADLVVGLTYTPLVLVLLRGTALKVFLALGVLHLALVVTSDYKAKVPLNVPYVPLVYMNALDTVVILCGIALPFLVDGFDGPMKVFFPVFNILLVPTVHVFLDPCPPPAAKAADASSPPGETPGVAEQSAPPKSQPNLPTTSDGPGRDKND
jgi:hypothetical protein